MGRGGTVITIFVNEKKQHVRITQENVVGWLGNAMKVASAKKNGVPVQAVKHA